MTQWTQGECTCGLCMFILIIVDTYQSGLSSANVNTTTGNTLDVPYSIL